MRLPFECLHHLYFLINTSTSSRLTSGLFSSIDQHPGSLLSHPIFSPTLLYKSVLLHKDVYHSTYKLYCIYSCQLKGHCRQFNANKESQFPCGEGRDILFRAKLCNSSRAAVAPEKKASYGSDVTGSAQWDSSAPVLSQHCSSSRITIFNRKLKVCSLRGTFTKISRNIVYLWLYSMQKIWSILEKHGNDFRLT